MEESQKRAAREHPTGMVYDRKFDTAIRKSDIISFQTRYSDSKSTFDDQILINSMTEEEIRKIGKYHTDINPYADLFFDIMISDRIRPKKRTIVIWNRIITQIMLLMQVQLTYLSATSSEVLPGIDKIFDNLKTAFSVDDYTLKILELVRTFESLPSKLSRLHPILRDRKLSDEEKKTQAKQVNSWKIDKWKVEFVWSKRMALIRLKQHTYLVPRVYLLLIVNKLCDQLSVLLLARTCDSTTYERGCYNTTVEFIRELCTTAVSLQERFFPVAKLLEALCVADTIRKVDSWANDSYFKVLCSELYGAVKFSMESSRLYRFLDDATHPFRHELSCLSKLFGHPFVDMESGTQAIFDATHMDLPIDRELLMYVIRNCKQSFIRNYIAKHGTWPLVEWTVPPNLAPKTLFHACLKGMNPGSRQLEETYGRAHLKDYDYVELKPIMEFDKLENVLPYLKDKTISLLRSEVLADFINNDPTVYRPTKWKQTRLLLAYLIHPEILTNHVEYIDEYTFGDLDTLLDYLVIRIVPKEKELKIDYRGFGCKTYEDRMRGIAQEKNVMHFLDTYSDEQAMTPTEISLRKKLSAFRNIQAAHIGYKVLYINVDASKWNNRFRHEVVGPLMSQTLDKLFDFPIFSRTHEAYHKTLFYVPDSLKTYHWEGQLGGIEGLNQDTWVVTYLNQLKACFKDMELRYFALCKGDDLRVVLLVPPHLQETESMESVRARVIAQLSTNAKLLGHKIKVDDSYGSETYFAFSKAASIANVEMPQGFRKIQKAHGSNNAFLPLFDDYIASAFSNAHSAASTMTSPVGPYVVACFWSFYYLSLSNVYKGLTDERLAALLLVPSILGGFPVIYLHNMFVRAESDLLSAFKSIYDHCLERYQNIASHLSEFLNVDAMPPAQGFRGLLTDPFCLPIEKPMLPSSHLRARLRQLLDLRCAQPTVQELLRRSTQSQMKPLIDSMYYSNVWNPRVMAAIYAASPAGFMDELITRFETARSVVEALIMMSGMRSADKAIKTVLKHDEELQKWRLNVILGKHNYTVSLASIVYDCPAQWAQHVREKLWKAKIEGITMPPMAHQIYLANSTKIPPNQWEANAHFLYTVTPHNNIRSHSPSLGRQFSGGNQLPFIGHTTRKGVGIPIMQFIRKDPMLSKVQVLLELRSFVMKTLNTGNASYSSNYYKIIDHVIGMYTDHPLERLSPFSGKWASGTITHHMRCPKFRESIVPNLLSNMYTQFCGESDTHRLFRSSVDKQHVNYLQIYCHVIGLWALGEIGEKESHVDTSFWGVTTNCKFCIRPIIETPLITHSPPGRTTPFCKFSITEGSLQLLARSVEQSIRTTYNLRDGADMNPVDAMMAVVQDCIKSASLNYQAVRDSTTRHVLTARGQQLMSHISLATRTREIGRSELCRIPTRYLASALGHYVMATIDTTLNLEASFDSFTESSIIRGLPGPELPWTPFLYFLAKNQRLQSLVAFLLTELSVPSSRSIGEPLRIPHLIGIWALDYVRNTAQTYFITHLSYEEMTHLPGKYTLLAAGIRRQTVRQLMARVQQFTRQHRITKKKETIMQLFIMCQVPVLSPERLTEEYPGLTAGVSQYSGEGPLFDLEAIVPNIMTWYREQSSWTDLAERIVRWKPNWGWADAMSTDLDVINKCVSDLRQLLDYYTIRYVLSDMHTCITAVRTQPPIQADEDEDIIHDQQNIQISLKKRAPDLLWSLRGSCQQQSTKVVDFPGNPVSTNQFIPDVNIKYRRYIKGECTAPRIHRLMSNFRHNIKELVGPNIACFGDGSGGGAYTFATMASRPIIHFNTYAPATEDGMILDRGPTLAQTLGCRINREPGSDGVHDLSIPATLSYWEFYLGQSGRYGFLDVLWLDADPRSYEEAIDVHKNVDIFFQRNSHSHSLYIKKVLMRDLGTLCQTVGILGPWCRGLWVLRCPTLQIWDSAVMVVIYGNTLPLCGRAHYFQPNLYCSEVLQKTLLRDVGTKLSDWIQESFSQTWKWDISLLGHPQDIDVYHQNFDTHFGTWIQESHGENLEPLLKRTLRTSLETGQRITLDAVIRRLTHIQETYIHAVSGNDLGIQAFVPEADTRARLLVKGHSICEVEGALYVLRESRRGATEIRTISVFESYRSWVTAPPITNLNYIFRRLQWSPVHELHMTHLPIHDRTDDRPFRRYMRGALKAYSFVCSGGS